MDIRNAAAVVTGAASGLGAATAQALVAAGARVVGLDLDVAQAPEAEGVTYRNPWSPFSSSTTT